MTQVAEGAATGHTERVLVTGVGLLTPLGNTVEAFIGSLWDQGDAFSAVPYFDTDEYPTKHGAIIGRPHDYQAFAAARPEWETAELYGTYCALAALQDAGIEPSALDPFRTAVAVASSNAGVETNHTHAVARHDGTVVAGETVVRTPATVGAAIRTELGLRGPQVVVSTACAAGGNSIGMGVDYLRSGAADLVLTGGAEPFSELSYSGFTLLKSLSQDRLRPFAEDRDGTALGEAACIFVLETETSARRRGATVYGEILGYGISNDAYHATAPDPDGGGAVLAMQQCLAESGLEPTDIDYINAHGTGTRYNDVMELNALQSILGDHLSQVPVSSTKSLHGHTLSCAGSIELLACLVGLQRGFIPGNSPTMTTLSEFPRADLPLSSQHREGLDVALSNSFGFAGNNTCIAVRRSS